MAEADVLEALLPHTRRSDYTYSRGLLAQSQKRQTKPWKLYPRGMDPLSVSASIVALVGAATTAVKIIKKLHDAPSEVCGLLEEISDLQAVLAGLHTVVTNLSAEDRSPTTRLLTQSLSDLLDRAKSKIVKIGGIIHGILDRPAAENGKAKVSRVSWLMEKSNVRALQEDIRSIKLSLALLLGAVASDNISRVQAQVVEFSCMTRDFLNTRVQTGLETSTISSSTTLSPSDDEESFDYPDAVGEHDHQVKGVIERNVVGDVKAVVPGRPPPTKNLVRRSSRSACLKSCKCACHKRNRLATPDFLKPVFGSASIGFEGLPWQNWSCAPECKRRSNAATNIQYQFPRWLMMKNLQASFQQAIGGPEFLLRVSRQLPSQNKLTSLIYQAQVDAVRTMFVEKLASPFDVAGPTSNPSLFHAIHGESAEMCKLLMDFGADMYTENDDGTRSIDRAWDYILALPEGKKRDEFAELFKSDDYFDDKGFNIVHRIATGVSTNISLEDALIASGEDVDAQDKDGRTALSWAVSRGDFTSAQTLLAYEASPNIPDRVSSPPLFYACRAGSLECVNLLLSYGADSSVSAGWGDGALHNAVKFSSGTPELAWRLILAGAPVNLRDRCGWTPICYAACFGQDAQIVETLMDHGADMRNQEESGMTPLMQAIKFNSYECVKVMFKKHPEWERTTTDWRGGSVLHMAADYADATTLGILANERLAGVDLERRNSADQTAHEVFEERIELEDDHKLIDAWHALVSSVREQEQPEQYTDDSFIGLEKGMTSTSISDKHLHHSHIHSGKKTAIALEA
ncbi:ankyrin [Viridothelium virens]|uniref:Ankyrin n=1 Tax=Viridothelium virens TaxID=1048519 RepID=A0A6A6HFH0_VIRVR|nr:ankyrin [Viridothelium virens]